MSRPGWLDARTVRSATKDGGGEEEDVLSRGGVARGNWFVREDAKQLFSRTRMERCNVVVCRRKDDPRDPCPGLHPAMPGVQRCRIGSTGVSTVRHMCVAASSTPVWASTVH